MFNKHTRFFSFIYFFFICSSFSVFAQSIQLKKNNTNNFIISNHQVPDSILSVIEYATDVWSSYISSEIPVRVNVIWTPLSNTVHAYAKPGLMYSNIEGLPLKDVLYPVALAEKLLSKNLNFNQSDIDLVINSNIIWHIDYMSLPPSDKYDLATILIHEICHGLGMIGNISSQNSSLVLTSLPTIYDTFLYYNNEIPIVNYFNNSSISQDFLKKRITSDSIFWNGRYASSFIGFSPQMFSPSPFDFGSSLYHFHENLFIKGNENALMTPILQEGEHIHNPGIAALAVLADIGWTDFFIQHTSISNSSDVQSPTKISLQDSNSFFNSFLLFYSYDEGKNFLKIPISFDSNNSIFSVELSLFPFEHYLSYAIMGTTISGDSVFLPTSFPQSHFKAFIGEDIKAPTIEHTHRQSIPINTFDFELIANIYDDFDIDSAFVRFVIGRNNFSTIIANSFISLEKLNTYYLGILDLQKYNLQEGDVIAYNIFAVDKSSNTSSFVALGDYLFTTLDAIQDPLHFFLTDFEHDSIQSYFFLNKFTISLENGFQNKALHTLHPYASSYIDGKYEQYIAELKYPIVIASYPAFLEFDQVVLVEPSEPNVEFGMFGYWDYVIVEATKDKRTQEWFPLGKRGYDSRLHIDWFHHFYSAIVPDNNNSSVAVGNSSLYKKHVINLLENKYFRVADTIFIRFRLQSDFNRHGWGWAIDNLTIQERMALQYQTLILDTPNIKLFPNPCTDRICIHADASEIKNFFVFDMHGRILMESDNSDACIFVSKLLPGLYCMHIELKNGATFVRSFIKQ